MEHKHLQREEIIGGMDKLTQEIINLKNNLTEILDYIDLRQEKIDDQVNQQRNLIEGISKEIEELERILEEKKINLSGSEELQEKHLRLAHSLASMEQSVLNEYQQILDDIGKNLAPSSNLEPLAPSHKKKLIDEYLSEEEKLPIDPIGNVLKIDNFGIEEIYDDNGNLACVFYKSYDGNLLLSSDVLMKYLSDTVKKINSLYFDYCKAATQKKGVTSQLPGAEPIISTISTNEEEVCESGEEQGRYLSQINHAREQVLKLMRILTTKEGLPGEHWDYSFENSTFEILNENTLLEQQNQFELDLDQFFARYKGLSGVRDLVEKYKEYREGLGEERYLDSLLQQLGYPNTGQIKSIHE